MYILWKEAHDFKVDKKQIELQDYEILGVGAQKKQNLLREHEFVNYTLVRHQHSFLPTVYEDTLQWLKPELIRDSDEFDKDIILRQEFALIFPRAVAALGDLSVSILNDYVQEMPWVEGLVWDHFRYLPEYVHRRFPQQEIYHEIFQWEWVEKYLSYVDLGGLSQSEPDILKVNASLMVVSVRQAAVALQKEPGLYVFVYNERTGRVVSERLSPLMAQILDTLAEDRKFSSEQLCTMVSLDKPELVTQVQETLGELVKSGIVRG